MEKRNTIDKLSEKIFKLILPIAILIYLMVMSLSCKPCENIVSTVVKDSIIERVVERKVYIKSPSDSASIRMRFSYDSIKRIVYYLVSERNVGDRINPNVIVTTSGNDLVVDFNCKEDSLLKIVSVYDNYTKELRSKINQVESKEKKSFWDTKFGNILFAIIWILIGAVIGYVIFSIFKLIK